MKKDKRFSLRLRTYYLLIIAIVVIISFGAVVGALTALQQLGVIGHINVSTLVALLLVAAAASGSASFLVGRRVLAPMVKLSKASREVARGNYSITVEDPSKLEEVQTTLRNFNALVREMNRINNVTNDFVSSVSHGHPKTPLDRHRGLCHAPAGHRPDAGGARRRYLDKILYNTHRLSTLVGNILMLSKLENQSLSDQRSTFRLDEQLRQAVVMLEPQWEEKSLSFRAELDAVSVTACEPLLLQVWTNLIGNAIKFSEPGQELSLRLLDQTECAVVSVMDHGCGMTPEVQARIFREILSGRQLPQGYGQRPRPAACQAHRRAVRRCHRGRQRPRAGLDVPRHPAEKVKQTLQPRKSCSVFGFISPAFCRYRADNSVPFWAMRSSCVAALNDAALLKDHDARPQFRTVGKSVGDDERRCGPSSGRPYRACTSASVRVSMEDVASSRISTGGSATAARAMVKQLALALTEVRRRRSVSMVS